MKNLKKFCEFDGLNSEDLKFGRNIHFFCPRPHPSFCFESFRGFNGSKNFENPDVFEPQLDFYVFLFFCAVVFKNGISETNIFFF